MEGLEGLFLFVFLFWGGWVGGVGWGRVTAAAAAVVVVAVVAVVVVLVVPSGAEGPSSSACGPRASMMPLSQGCPNSASWTEPFSSRPWPAAGPM